MSPRSGTSCRGTPSRLLMDSTLSTVRRVGSRTGWAPTATVHDEVLHSYFVLLAVASLHLLNIHPNTKAGTWIPGLVRDCRAVAAVRLLKPLPTTFHHNTSRQRPAPSRSSLRALWKVRNMERTSKIHRQPVPGDTISSPD